MKLPVALLAASLAANVALFATLSLRSPSTAPTAASSATPSVEAVTAREAEAKRAAEAEKQALAQIWKPEKTGDFGPLIERLRAAGFPIATIRAIVRTQIEEQFAARRRALTAGLENQPAWKASRVMDPKINAELRALYREQTALMKSLLGDAARDTSEEMMAYQRRYFGDLPPDKIDRLQQLMSDYSETRQEVYNLMGDGGAFLPEDREKLAAIEKAQRADMAKILTPEELFEYDLRSSGTASQLRTRLMAFKPTEEEFRAIFKIQNAVDQEMGGSNVYTAADFNARQARQTEVNKQIEAVLSSQRAADYALVSNPSNQALGRVIARFDLPLTTIKDVSTIQQQTMQQATAVQRESSLTPEARTAQLTTIAQQASAQIEQKLGTRAFAAYRENGGQWLDSMTRAQRIAPRP